MNDDYYILSNMVDLPSDPELAFEWFGDIKVRLYVTKRQRRWVVSVPGQRSRTFSYALDQSDDPWHRADELRKHRETVNAVLAYIRQWQQEQVA